MMIINISCSSRKCINNKTMQGEETAEDATEDVIALNLEQKKKKMKLRDLNYTQ